MCFMLDTRVNTGFIKDKFFLRIQLYLDSSKTSGQATSPARENTKIKILEDL